VERTRYNLINGEVLYCVSATGGFLVDQLLDGVGEIEGHFDSSQFFIENGQPIPKPQKPSEFCVFDYGLKQWVEGEQQVVAAKVFAAGELYESISAARRRFITILPGQEMIYLAKEAEAIRYLGLTQEPESLADFPLLAAEIGITTQTAYQLAQIWVFMSSSWRAAAAQIEAIRLSTNAAIQGAQTVSEALSVLDQARTALNQINP